jgi:peptidoglycan hydrolase-like protein with peptidoglycan-binding domain
VGRLSLRRPLAWAAAVAVAAAVMAHSGAASTTYTHGYDISWPQCRGSHASSLPGSGATYVILGLTHGAGHTTNPCLSGQVAWAKAHHVLAGAYLVPSYPTPREQADASTGPAGTCGDADCRRANDGAKQAADALAVMNDAGLPAPMVWVDVEFRHYRSWSTDRTANADVIRGVFLGLESAHVPYGVYTTSYMWKKIVGGMQADVPNWLPGGSGKPADARAVCRATGTGGPTWLGQYTRHFDEDLTCPAMDATPGHPGPLWPYRHMALSLGSTGAAVTALQHAIGTLEVTGTYDDQTLASVLAFQGEHDVPVDGTFDDDDWKALGADDLVGGHGFLLPQVVAPIP